MSNIYRENPGRKDKKDEDFREPLVKSIGGKQCHSFKTLEMSSPIGNDIVCQLVQICQSLEIR